MDTNKLLTDAGYRMMNNFGEIAAAAADMVELYPTEAELMRAIGRMYGVPSNMGMRDKAAPVHIVGEGFEPATLNQLYTAAKCPIVKRAALLPDGHPGYGVPIGSVIMTEHGTVIPYAVGVDIACRMRLTILDIEKDDFLLSASDFAYQAQRASRFGAGAEWPMSQRHNHEVMSDERWDWAEDRLGKGTIEKAWAQLGTSGGGNHFLDVLVGKALKPIHYAIGRTIPEGKRFVALMTHSGSRGVGKQIADYYVKEAVRSTRQYNYGIPKELSWLELGSDVGGDYWELMHLMGDYASANHQLIHERFLRLAKLDEITHFENHHNFVWTYPEGIVHAKGATPARAGEFGIIPGSMGTKSYLCIGKGYEPTMQFSSHGAGRPFSRTEAKKRHDPAAYDELIQRQQVRAYGVTPDETAFAYKDIEQVMAAQSEIVEPVAEMTPVIVVMGGRSDDGD
jgi:tRNA-splicing ligase RtcB